MRWGRRRRGLLGGIGGDSLVELVIIPTLLVVGVEDVKKRLPNFEPARCVGR